MTLRKVIVFYTILSLITIVIIPFLLAECKADPILPEVKINIEPHTIIYEGDIIDCDITGEPTILYWMINNQSHHKTFYKEKPIIFDPEPTPLGTDYVNLTVYAENEAGKASDTIGVIIKRIYFGDIHWHTTLCDGDNEIDTMYQNAIKDNYLDFVCYTGHAEVIDGMRKSFTNLPWLDLNKLGCNLYRLGMRLQNVFHYIRYGYNDWETIKQKVNEYYNEGDFTTFLGFEWTAFDEPNCHINFYYKEVYPDAAEYASSDVVDNSSSKANLDEIFKAMSDEWDKGHLNVCFPHHPQQYKVNWTYLANNVNETYRDKVLRGVEVFSEWGTAIGQKFTPDLPHNWPYYSQDNSTYMDEAWVENAMWEWSENVKKGQPFAMMASSDIHIQNRPGSAKPLGASIVLPFNPSGIIAAYAIHNNRSEIWDAMNTCDMYATQLLKIRANVRFDGQMALGRWINCSSPLTVTITAQSTFPGSDNSDKSMCPHGYSSKELDYPISDIWLIKKDTEKGQPYCKVINHTTPDTNTAVVKFQDSDVQPNDFYYVAIRQKGELLTPKSIPLLTKLMPKRYHKWLGDIGNRDEYMAFIGPIFIDNVV